MIMQSEISNVRAGRAACNYFQIQMWVSSTSQYFEVTNHQNIIRFLKMFLNFLGSHFQFPWFSHSHFGHLRKCPALHSSSVPYRYWEARKLMTACL